MEQKLYTYKIELLVHVFAENEEAAEQALEQNQGNMTNKKVTLVNTTSIHNEL